jgi:hypothetical protein
VLLIVTVFPIAQSLNRNESNIYPLKDMPLSTLIDLTPEQYERIQKMAFKDVIIENDWYWYQSYPNYAPRGVPDFSQKQGNWRAIFDGGNGISESLAIGDDIQNVPYGNTMEPGELVVSPGPNCVLESGPSGDDYMTWCFCCPTAVANAFWWLDSKFGNPIGSPGDGNDDYPLVQDYGSGDDHAFENAPPLIMRLANAFKTTSRGGTYIEDLMPGIDQWFVDAGLENFLEAHFYEYPTFNFVVEEIKQEKAVCLWLVFLKKEGDECIPIVGHITTCAGVNVNKSKISMSDPFWDIQNPPNNPEEHNNPMNVSYEIFDVTLGSPCSNYPDIKWWLPDYPYWELTVVYGAVVINSTYPDVHCDDDLQWIEVTPSSTINGSFTVENIGDNGSLLDWKITPPSWGEWEFEPDGGVDLTPEDGPVIVHVSVVAPNKKNKEYDGNINIVDKEKSWDYCTISVNLQTPKSRGFGSNQRIQRFLIQHPNMFPLLRQLFGL